MTMETRIAFLDYNLSQFENILERQATSIGGKEIKSWMTINGQHVPIFENETKEEAGKRFVKEKNMTPDEKKESQSRDKKEISKIRDDKLISKIKNYSTPELDKEISKTDTLYNNAKEEFKQEYSEKFKLLVHERGIRTKNERLIREKIKADVKIKNEKINKDGKWVKTNYGEYVLENINDHIISHTQLTKIDSQITSINLNWDHKYRTVTITRKDNSVQKIDLGYKLESDDLNYIKSNEKLYKILDVNDDKEDISKEESDKIIDILEQSEIKEIVSITSKVIRQRDMMIKNDLTIPQNIITTLGIEEEDEWEKHESSTHSASTPTHLSNYKGKSGFFIKKFLISDKMNLNGWRVTWDAILKDLDTFIGVPVVLTPGKNHPTVAEQDQYKVGTIIDVGYDSMTKTAWQVSEITDVKTQKLILNGKIKFGSPTVHSPVGKVDTENTGTAAQQDTLHRFLGKHDALVSEPAYGKMKDVIKAVCEGDGKSCETELMHVEASVNDSAITIVPFTKIKNKKSDINTKIAFLDYNLIQFESMLEKQATSIGGKEIKSWMTINGQHVPIFENETKEDAADRFVQEKKSKEKSKTPNDTKLEEINKKINSLTNMLKNSSEKYKDEFREKLEKLETEKKEFLKNNKVTSSTTLKNSSPISSKQKFYILNKGVRLLEESYTFSREEKDVKIVKNAIKNIDKLTASEASDVIEIIKLNSIMSSMNEEKGY